MRPVRGLAAAAVMLIAVGADAGGPRRTPVVDAVSRASPAVVHIAGEELGPHSVREPALDEFYRDLGDPRVGGTHDLLSLGSGIIFDRRGYVLTNEHVVRGTVGVRAILAGGRELEAEVIGVDPASDLAVLRLRDAGDVPWIEPGTSSDLMIGETLIAIGNPFGLSHTVTTGVLSAKDRSVRAGRRLFADFLQTDASINPGNSGGPILNLAGELVGVATAIHRSGRGIGFAIPIDRAARVAASLIDHGRVQPVWIGLSTKSAGAGLQRDLGLPPGQGVVVTSVVEGGPAQEAGARRGDIVINVAGHPVGTAAELDSQLWHQPRDAPIALEIGRHGHLEVIRVRPLEPGSQRLLQIAERLLGLRLSERRGHRGLLVTEVDEAGPGAGRGIRPGDIVHQLDGRSLDDLDSFRQGFYAALANRTALLLVEHGEAAFYLPLRLD